MRDLMFEAAKLPPTEQIELAEYLLGRAAKKSRYKGKVADLREFYGILELSEDPLEYQRRVRSEWP